MTRKEWYEELKGIVVASDYEDQEGALEFLNHEIDKLSAKRAKTETAVDRANVILMDTIVDVLAEQEAPVAVSNLVEDPRLHTYEVEKHGTVEEMTMTPQKLSALLKKLIADGRVVKTVEKKKSYFVVA